MDGYKKSYEPIQKEYLKNVNIEDLKPQRAGVIMYTYFENKIYFGMGYDAKSHDVTDFGGGVIYKKDGNAITGALREFSEETLHIFNVLKIDEIIESLVLYDNENLVIFLNLNVNPDEVCEKFKIKYDDVLEKNKKKRQDILDNNGSKTSFKKVKDPEVCCITWYTWHEFIKIYKKPGIVFSRLQKFLYHAGEFMSYL